MKGTMVNFNIVAEIVVILETLPTKRVALALGEKVLESVQSEDANECE